MKKQSSKNGVTIVEYALLMALVAIAIIPAVKELGNSVSSNLSSSSKKFSGETKEVSP